MPAYKHTITIEIIELADRKPEPLPSLHEVMEKAEHVFWSSCLLRTGSVDAWSRVEEVKE